MGGTVRDRELKRASPDLDLVAEGDVRSLAAEVAELSGRPWFPLSHEFGAYRVVGREGHLDLAALRGGSLDSDLALRDFTMNAMALPTEGGPLIDPYGGRRDLLQGRLKAVSPTIFADDPLRLLRAARFMHVLGMKADPGLEGLVRAQAWRLPSAAAERMLSEISLTLQAGRSAAAFCLWSDLGLLERLFPEVSRLRGLEQSGYHQLDAYGHTLEAAARMDEIFECPGRFFPMTSERLGTHLAQPVDGVVSRPVALRLAALLHDAGKATTKTVHEQRGIMFWGHTEVGARLAGDACRRLRCSAALTSLITTVVREHLRLGVLAREGSPAPRDVVRYFWSASPWEPEALLLSVADRLATRGPLVSEEQVQTQLRLADQLAAEWWRRTSAPAQPPVDGNLLMAELGLRPGPLLGEILQELRLAFEAGEFQSQAEALGAARAYLQNRGAERQFGG